jgi:hypothetical protein
MVRIGDFSKLSRVSVEPMRGMLKLRQAEIRQRVEEEAARLERVELWLREIEQEDSMSRYDVVIKKVEQIYEIGTKKYF